MKSMLILCFLLINPATALTDTIFVPDDFATIQDAIDASAKGDTVIVRPGTYVENIDFIGKEIVLKSEKGPAVTTIDGNQSGSVVNFENWEGPDAVIDGFTITNGVGVIDGFGGGIRCLWSAPVIAHNWIVANEAGHGAGISCWAASPVIHDNRILQNIQIGTPSSAGGGIAILNYSNPTISENEITQNQAINGGGISCGWCSRPLIEGNTIFDNSAYSSGGGISIVSSDSEVRQNRIIGNTTSLGKGGGLYCDRADSIVVDNEIIGNECSDGGGGIYFSEGELILTNNMIADNQTNFGTSALFGAESTILMVNNTFAQNVSAWSDYGVALGGCPNVEIHNTIFWSNAGPNGFEIALSSSTTNDTRLAIWNSIVEGGQNGIEVHGGSSFYASGIIDADPLFADRAAGDFHIRADSPARDQGNIGASGLPWNDFEGDPRVPAATVDIGADEFHTHLYALGEVIPGNSIVVKVVGAPGAAPVRILAGTGVRIDPLYTMYGDFYLEGPLNVFTFGPIPPEGIFTHTATVPVSWASGDAHPFQALVGTWGNPGTELSNLMVLSAD